MTRRGYTLVEVTVALALTALVMGALAGMVAEGLRARTVAAAVLGRVTTARTALLHLERELTAALPETFSVSAEPSALRFTGGSEPGARLAYVVEHGALVRRVTPRFASADAPPGQTIGLVDDVVAFEVGVLDAGEWKTTWSGDAPPRAVRLRLTLAGTEPLEIVVPIATGRGRHGA